MQKPFHQLPGQTGEQKGWKGRCAVAHTLWSSLWEGRCTLMTKSGLEAKSHLTKGVNSGNCLIPFKCKLHPTEVASSHPTCALPPSAFSCLWVSPSVRLTQTSLFTQYKADDVHWRLSLCQAITMHTRI